MPEDGIILRAFSIIGRKGEAEGAGAGHFIGLSLSLSLSLSLCPSHVASIIAKIISKSNELSLENFSEKYILDNEWIIIFQFE